MPTKLCSSCNKIKDLKDFSKKKTSKDGYQGQCKACKSAYESNWYRNNLNTRLPQIYRQQKKARSNSRQEAISYLKCHPCVDCGETDILVLDFDHRDRAAKSYNVSLMITRGILWETILKEIAKCEIRCANCHRRKTARENNDYRFQSTLH